MTAPGFTQVGQTRLYASSAMGDAGLPGYWAGYLASAHLSLTPTLDLTATWQDVGGGYLFLRTTPADLDALSTALIAWLPSAGSAGPPRFLWLENPDDPSAYWRATTWYALGLGVAPDLRWTTWGISQWRLGAYSLQVAAGAALTLSSGNPAHVTIAAGATLFYAPGSGFTPSSANGIALQGPTIGVWGGEIAIAGADLADLGVELRYAIRASRDPADPRLSPISMPILGVLDQPSSLEIGLDPLHPFTRGRTRLRFASSPTIASGLVTQRGYATALFPMTPSPPLWDSGLMFCRCASRIDGDDAESTDTFSLAPDGAYGLQVVAPQGGAGPGLVDQLQLGLSGFESVQLATNYTILLFTAGEPAFAPTVALDGSLPAGEDALLTDAATTAWIAAMPQQASAPGLAYFAQSRQSPFYSGGGGALAFQPVPAARLAPLPAVNDALPASYPVGVYSGIANSQFAAARALETAALAPKRRQQIVPSRTSTSLATTTDTLAITPRGLTIAIDVQGETIDEVVVASLPGSTTPQLAFANPGPDFVAAILANQLFFVVADPAVLTAQATCVPPFALDLDGWRFDLDPAHWRAGKDPTLMVWKYADRSLEALAADTAAWGWPEAAGGKGGGLAATWRILNDLIGDARRAVEADPQDPLAAFYHDVVQNPGWNGVLFLNAPVSLGALPPELRFLAAGIDPGRFFAHHVGIGATAFDATTSPPTLLRSSVFGLISYVDTVDLVPEQTRPFAFKTMQLTARFANARLAGFSTQIELALNQLYGAPLLKKDALNGNNLLVAGSLQSSGGSPAYAFSIVGQNRFSSINSVVIGVEIRTLRLETQANPLSVWITCSFVLGGRLEFLNVEDFDLFSYGAAPGASDGDPPFEGYLVFNQLVVTMDFALSKPQAQIWTASETGVHFDLPNSRPRPDSLIACFPVTARAFVSSPDLTPLENTSSGVSPEDMGYLSISAPIDQAPMAPPWYGLVMSLDLGSLGALAGSVGLKVELLAAWYVTGPNTLPALYLGLKLPGASARGGFLPLQGVLSLGFKNFVFSTYQQNSQRAYLLRLSRFTLSLLGFHFPPGNLDISLFGGRDGRSAGQLGWLAAYSDPDREKAKSTPSAAKAGLSRPARAKRIGRIPTRS